jgi:hypothetical protein
VAVSKPGSDGRSSSRSPQATVRTSPIRHNAAQAAATIVGPARNGSDRHSHVHGSHARRDDGRSQRTTASSASGASAAASCSRGACAMPTSHGDSP